MRSGNVNLEKAKKVKALLESNYNKHYTYEQLSQLVGTNEFDLKVSFKKLTNESIYHFLTRIRVEKAKHLLQNTDHTIQTIAQEMGWDKSNLTKQFKKITGRTPSQWRKEL